MRTPGFPPRPRPSKRISHITAIGAWLSPVVLAAVAARVVAGDGGAPMLAATVASAPLIALVLAAGARARAAETCGVADLAVVIALALVLAANLVVIGDLARLLGLARVHGIVAGAVLAVVVVVWPAGDRWWRVATPVGVGIVLLPLGLVTASTGTPWAAWAAVASRPALTFDARSAWVTEGRPLPEGTTLTFVESHRVVASGPATWRVIDRDTARVSVREWRLAPGDALTLRPGDQLAVDPGTRIRFEAGRRVPGAPPSGVTWADGGTRSVRDALAVSLGAAFTLVAGGLAITPVGAVPLAGAIAAPILLLAFVVGATVWGLYGIALAPDLALVPRALAPMLEVVTRISASPWRTAFLGLVIAGVVALFVGSVLTGRARLAGLIGAVAVAVGRPAAPPLALAAGTAGLVAAATAIAVLRDDPWKLFTVGLGVAAAVAVAPRLARAGRRGELIGAVVGALVLGGVHVARASVPAVAAPLVEDPALAAAPLAWLAARLTRTRGRATRG